MTLIIRAFLNLWAMACKNYGLQSCGLHENAGNYKSTENNEDNSDSHKQRGLSAGFTEMTERKEMTKPTGIWGASHVFPK